MTQGPERRHLGPSLAPARGWGLCQAVRLGASQPSEQALP